VSDETERRLGLGLGGSASGGWTAPSVEELAGALPGLRVLELAGRGGMGAVYRAEQVRLGRVVAVKLLPAGATADPMARERFEREARVLAGLNHPRVLRIFDFGTLPNGASYLVTEWAEGGDLAARIAGQAQEPKTVAAWVAQIAEALEAAHAKGVVHRDLKPANVLVRGDGGLALGDFGLARAEGAGFTTALTMSGVIFGTVDYMAPEQMGPSAAGAAAEVTKAVDIYALGVMTYQMLTGRVPRGVFAPASRFTGVAKEADAVISAAMAAEPERRPKSAGEFARRLSAAVAKGGRMSNGRRWGRLAAIGGCGVCAVAAALAYVRQKERRDTLAAETREAAVTTTRPGVTIPVRDAAPPASISARAAEGMRWILSDVEPGRDRASGGWERQGDELRANDGVCALRLPVRVPADFRYDVKVEFTRLSGKNSVGVFLPTSSGVGVFELDAWDAGLGGIQMIDDQDMRAHGENFPGALRNGERQLVTLEVRGARVTAIWKGRVQRSWDLIGRRFTNPWLWDAGRDMQLGLCSWKSPTVFHRVGVQTVGEER
jgi:hypothetical protein